jgi:threonine dehydratase
MDLGWNLSLFHYRNHGADIGRVLVGLQVRQKTKQTGLVDRCRRCAAAHF